MGTKEQDAIRVAIVEDDVDTRLLVRMAADLDTRYQLVGEFETLRGAVTGLLTCPVDVVIVNDLDMGSRCRELFAQLRAAVGGARIVVVAANDRVPVELAMAAGADAFLESTAFTHVADALQLATGRLEVAARTTGH